MLRSHTFVAFLLAFLAVLPAGSVYAATKPVTVTRLTWHGWPGSVRVSNGIVEAVVVPAIGRIMSFQFVGRPETSPVFVNKEWDGKTVADADPVTWAAFGGDKLWPAPQSEWPNHNVRAWPPDQTFDGDPEVAQIVPNGVRLTTPDSVAFAARATRTFTMTPGQPRLYIAQTLIKDPDAANPPGLVGATAAAAAPESQNAAARQHRDGFPIGIWSITQTRGDGAIFLPLATGGPFPTGYLSLGDPEDVAPAPYFTTQAGLLRIARDPSKSHKIGAGSSAGWMASLYGGTLLFSEHYPYQSGAAYPDGGTPAEVYTNGGATAYIEMELLGPLVSLTHGNKISHDIYWQLQRLPRAPKSAAEAARLVTAAMRQAPEP
jgi:hypothetical protein